jgi:hypothetical protein
MKNVQRLLLGDFLRSGRAETTGNGAVELTIALELSARSSSSAVQRHSSSAAIAIIATADSARRRTSSVQSERLRMFTALPSCSMTSPIDSEPYAPA